MRGQGMDASCCRWETSGSNRRGRRGEVGWTSCSFSVVLIGVANWRLLLREHVRKSGSHMVMPR